MKSEAALARLEALLLEERDAIVRFDTERVDRFTDEKLALLTALQADPGLGADLAPRYRALLVEVRHNIALLSHGRACLRDIIAALGGGGSEPHAAPRTGLRVRVTG